MVLLAGTRTVENSRREGAIHAVRLAAGADDLAGAVLLSPSATPGEELLRWQTANVVDSMPAWLRRLLRGRPDAGHAVGRPHGRSPGRLTAVAAC